MQMDFFNKAQMERVCVQLIGRTAETHRGVGHKVNHLDGDWSMECEVCGLIFTAMLMKDNLFGFLPSLTVAGKGRPYTTVVIEELKKIAHGEHRRFGVEGGSEVEYCGECGREKVRVAI